MLSCLAIAFEKGFISLRALSIKAHGVKPFRKHLFNGYEGWAWN